MFFGKKGSRNFIKHWLTYRTDIEESKLRFGEQSLFNEMYEKNILDCQSHITIIEVWEMRFLQGRPCFTHEIGYIMSSSNKRFKCWKEGDWILHLPNHNAWEMSKAIKEVKRRLP